MSQTLTGAVTSEKRLVSNQSATDVIILKASLKTAASRADRLYDLPLTELPAGNSGPLLKAGAQTSVTIPDLTEGELYSQIIAKASNVFPIKVATLTTGTQSQALTGTDEDFRDMQQAEQFLASVTALPSSRLAKDFSTALSGRDPAQVDGFFQGTEAYQQLTLEKVLAVQTYHHSYPYVWARYGNSITYELHTSDGTAASVTGSLQINCNASCPASIDKSNPDFTMVYEPAGQGGNLPLKYAAGTFRDSGQRISLQGIFMVKSQFTGKEADNEVIGVLRGSVDGTEVLGFPRETGGSEPWISLDGMLHPDDLKDWLEISIIIASLSLVLLGFTAALARVVYVAIWSKNAGTASSGPDYLKEDSDEEISQNDEQEMNQDYALLENRMQLKQLQNTRSILVKQQEYLRNLVKIANTDDLQRSGDYLSDAMNSIDKDITTVNKQIEAKSKPDEAAQERLPEFMKEMNLNMQRMQQAYKSLKSRMNNTQKQQIKELAGAIDTLTESFNETEKSRERYQAGYREEEYNMRWFVEGD